MKINCIKTNLGTTVNIYVSNSELQEKKMFPEISSAGKDYRVKRSFSIKLSKKAMEAVEIILQEMLNHLNDNMVFFQAMGVDGLSERLKIEMRSRLNEYQCSKIKLILEDIAIPVLLNKSTIKDIDTIRDRYKLALEDILVTFIGGFGFGKTTTIKKILGFDDTYRFLLVDNGRTTIYNTIIKGLIVNRNGEIECKMDNDEFEKIPVDKYRFKNSITLHSSAYIYHRLIVPNLQNAFEKYKSFPSDGQKTILEFIRNSNCNLDGLFGAVNEDSITNGFYKTILDEFHKCGVDDIEDDSDIDFNQNEIIEKTFEEYLKKAVEDAIEIIKGCIGEVQTDSKGPGECKISFELTKNEIGDIIDLCYKPFTDNSLKGGSLRICVKEIYLETDLDMDNFFDAQGEIVSPQNLYEGHRLKYHSFVFADTVGCGHTQETESNEKNIDVDISSNSSILNESDVVILIDKANETMQQGVKNQLYTLENLGLKGKLLLCYTYYNQFIKADMETDDDRERQLDTYLEDALKSLYPIKEGEIKSKKAQIYYEHLTQNKKQNIIYLKGLVPRTKTMSQNEPKKKSRRSSASSSSQLYLDDKKAEILNAGFEDSEACLAELIEKIIFLNEDLKNRKNNPDFSITSYHRESKFIMDYSDNIYNKVALEYLKKEKNIYYYNTPAYNTTKALCYNAYIGDPVHYGSSITLRPIEDLKAVLQAYVSEFLDSPNHQFLIIEKENDVSDHDLNLEFLKDELKQNLSKSFSKFLMEIMVKGQNGKWKALYSDRGSGVKMRRGTGIYAMLKDVILMETMKLKILEILTACIDEIVDNYNTIN